MMTEASIRKVVERYVDAWNQGDESALDEILDDAYTFNNPPPGLTPDKNGQLGLLRRFREAFPDQKVTPSEWVVERDRVVVGFTGTGTHKGEFMGVPASGNRINVTGIMLLTVRHGKVVEEHTEFDALTLMTQIGAIPEMPAVQ